ncbi:hypothetical protein TUM19329_25960 [Legionella antarctica]|uniref:Uncharacterized protein n=1 Tax=Legionella antarctica TaxID=2708020 RepID=A0A6F8T6B6_9GAMM|nr:hypothetical protein [Legionella antarctica]BCA96235.1 hypothetical protein TUM19329_25960 [Legionella antarctica]
MTRTIHIKYNREELLRLNTSDCKRAPVEISKIPGITKSDHVTTLFNNRSRCKPEEKFFNKEDDIDPNSSAMSIIGVC